MDIVERFLNYVKFDTQSCEDSAETPSTEKQFVFAKYLKEDFGNARDAAIEYVGCMLKMVNDR